MSIYRRFFVSPSAITGGNIELSEQYQHIAKVLRMRAGDQLIACCGDGIEHLCTISHIDNTTIVAHIDASSRSNGENSYSTTLYLAVLKGDKNDLVVQKAVELGVDRIVLFESKYTVSDVKESKLTRLSRIALEAGKQCGRAIVVEVAGCTFADIDLSQHQLSLVCYERQLEGSLANVVKARQFPQDIAIVIGSEGGLDGREVDSLVVQGAVPITLGSRILRAETAPIYVLSVLHSLYGEQ